MRSTRGTDPDPAARRLALLAADLGAPEPPEGRATPAPLPRPGRHASRRRRWSAELPGLPGLGASQLTVVALVVAVGVALTAWWVVRDQAEPITAPVAAGATSSPLVDVSAPASAAATEGTGEVTVDVTGKVRRPGIVVLAAGARVVDALEAAGGERGGVDLSTLNLARVLVDGEQIVVGAAQAPAVVPPGGVPPPGAPPSLVNLNTATAVELETLPDVGPVTAQSIVTWRDTNGGFTSIDELLEVDGIGEVTLDKLTPYITV
ncbi:ComEA family DNA-binding protein [Nocardioides humilatus]|uniref:ComEA family DNA-binding protein n=1 Tax=Nocardioides humilatus TaxID=2607660 RepID=A0A5B1LBT1_9ACTN|nr:helix-hairpin-helix domain-containing protein [Nocardioides humilatus]KAA1417734.1 ComEA family DNA-binding protein [Nocardioides humilatus]